VAHLSRNDRGQILLVAAFALAVIFVAMALIVNSAIFTENLASRGETSGSAGALSMRADVAAGVGEGIEAANRNNNSDLTNAVQASIGRISEQTGRQSARSGRVVDVSYESERRGQRIYQTDNSTFENGAGLDDYDVATTVSRVDDANGTRAFRIEARDITAGDNDSAFEVRAQASSATDNQHSWRARIWNAGGDTVHVKTLKNNGPTTVVEDCEVTKDSPGNGTIIDITDGTIDGEECEALGTNSAGENFHFGAGTGVTPGSSTESYDISFSAANEIKGNFSMVVYEGPAGSLAPDPDTGSDQALYDVTVRYAHSTADLRYETDVRVAPGEPDV